MNDLFTPASIITSLLGVVVGLLAWIGNRHIDRTEARLDSLDETIDKGVTRDELDATITQMREDRQRMHVENRENLHYIRERVDTIADRQR